MLYKKNRCVNKRKAEKDKSQRKICTAVGIQRRRRQTKPVRKKKLGPAFSSAAYDVILYQFEQSAQQFYTFEMEV